MEVAWCSSGRSERARLGVVARLPTTPVGHRSCPSPLDGRPDSHEPRPPSPAADLEGEGEAIDCFVLVPSRVVQMTPSDALSFSSLFGHLGNSDCLNPPESEKFTHDSGHHVDVLLQARGNRLDHGKEHRRKEAAQSSEELSRQVHRGLQRKRVSFQSEREKTKGRAVPRVVFPRAHLLKIVPKGQNKLGQRKGERSHFKR